MLEPLIEAILEDVPLEEVEARLEAADIAYGRLNEPAEVLGHPHVVAGERIRTVRTPGGDVSMLRPPFNVDGWREPDAATPAIGEHTDTILAELGYDAAARERLRATGAVA